MLRKLLNRSTVKVSYKGMPNMSSIVSSHNTKLLSSGSTQQQEEGCNCENGPETCPLNPAWTQHESDFRRKQKNTTLSAYICKLKEEGKQYTVKWDIMDRAPVFNPVTRKCRLCLKEIFYILFRPDSASLNKRGKLFNTCRHRKQKLLEKV